jgi:hypothetical protein
MSNHTNNYTSGDYMTVRDVYQHFGKRVSLDKCCELLHTGQIRSARIGGRWLTKKQYIEEYEQTVFLRASAPSFAPLTVTHETLSSLRSGAAYAKREQYLPLKQR